MPYGGRPPSVVRAICADDWRAGSWPKSSSQHSLPRPLDSVVSGIALMDCCHRWDSLQLPLNYAAPAWGRIGGKLPYEGTPRRSHWRVVARQPALVNCFSDASHMGEVGTAGAGGLRRRCGAEFAPPLPSRGFRPLPASGGVCLDTFAILPFHACGAKLHATVGPRVEAHVRSRECVEDRGS